MNDIKLFYEKEPEFFINLIKNKTHFKYSRFNDGEIIAASGISPNNCNCDKHQYFSEMGIELKNILLDYKFNEYYIIESYIYWYNTSEFIFNTLNDIKKINKNLSLLNNDFIRFLHEKQPDKYIELLNEIFNNKVCIIGPKYLQELNKYFMFDFIEVPILNCYLEKDNIINKINEYKKINNNNIIYLFSTSMLANIIINKYDDNNNTYIDWGSVWDTFFQSTKFNFIKKRSSSNKEIYNEIYKNFLI